MIEDLYAFGTFIELTRQKKGLSPADVARTLNMNHKNIKAWEEGQYLPSLELLPRIAEVLGVPFEKLKQAFDVSTEARRQQREARKPSKVKPLPDTQFPVFYGGGKTIGRSKR